MSSAIVASALLAATLAVAVMRPWGLPEAVGAVPAAVLVVVLGVLPLSAAVDEMRELGPTVAFLAAVLVLADLAEREGLFGAAGGHLVRGSRGGPQRFLVLVFVLGSVVTAVLSLDATVVLLTPVVLGAAARAGLRARPPVYACGHLANSASLLLPVSNLTNLLALKASGLSFAHFAALMALPWIGVILVEYVVFRRHFAADLAVVPEPSAALLDDPPPWPAYPLVVLGLTLAGFAAAGLVHVEAAWVAAAGALLLGVPALRSGRATPKTLVGAAALPFLAFVLGLGVVVRALQDSGLDTVVAGLVPSGTSLVELAAIALGAALVANLVNNLPAILMLLPAVSAVGPPAVLAALIGVNVGPNLTYVGSLATLLWRRLLHERDVEATQREFLRLGVVTVPAAILLGTVCLWASVAVIGA